ncbi:MAG: hypothetical protein WDO73_04770 [Ignavibacteriota bacterium]
MGALKVPFSAVVLSRLTFMLMLAVADGGMVDPSGTVMLVVAPVGIHHPIRRHPSLYVLAGGGDQVAGSIQLETAVTGVELIVVGILHHEEAVTLDGGIECATSGRDGALREILNGGKLSYSQTHLALAIAGADLLGHEVRGIPLCCP